MSRLGQPVTFRVGEKQQVKTIKGERQVLDAAGEWTGKMEPNEVSGSPFHPEMEEFAGLVTREHPDGTCDLAIFAPARGVLHITGISEGGEPGTFTLLTKGDPAEKGDTGPAGPQGEKGAPGAPAKPKADA